MSSATANGAASNPRAGQHGRADDLLRDDVRCFPDPDSMGALPDAPIPDASVKDRQAVLHHVLEKGWKRQYPEGSTVLPVPRTQAVPTRPADAESRTDAGPAGRRRVGDLPCPRRR
ncbi:hypothetical protein GCM10010377_81390 [Streptomyces viridiviolaceus]|nr:hypothetical protein GCM10010377_81390 [Streptomyces viridiviolaceus]